MRNIIVDESIGTTDVEVVEAPEVIETTVVEDTFELPGKFQGKTEKDIAKAYVELEKELGRKANEVGELRKLTDEYLRRELTKASPTPAKEEEEESDFFEDPKKAVKKAVESDPKIRELEERLAAKERKEALSEFTKKHPDYQEVGNDSEFHDWVAKSKYRTNMYVRADSMDLEAADELLDLWKDFKKVKAASSAEQEITEKRKRDLKAASGETSSTGEGRKKVYSRVELMRLRVNDPDKYNSMQQEIIDAYREGRVK